MADLTEQWRQAAFAFELRAMRVEYVIRLLIAAGHVTQEKVDEAFVIAREFKRIDPPPKEHPPMPHSRDGEWGPPNKDGSMPMD